MNKINEQAKTNQEMFHNTKKNHYILFRKMCLGKFFKYQYIALFLNFAVRRFTLRFVCFSVILVTVVCLWGLYHNLNKTYLRYVDECYFQDLFLKSTAVHCYCIVHCCFLRLFIWFNSDFNFVISPKQRPVETLN